jgi:hypothetical protein
VLVLGGNEKLRVFIVKEAHAALPPHLFGFERKTSTT